MYFEEASRNPVTNYWLPHDHDYEEVFPIRVEFLAEDGSEPPASTWDHRPRLLLRNPEHEADKKSKVLREYLNKRRVALNLSKVRLNFAF